jgi:succinoglycan biosynthesis transport protein ExoP
MLWSAPCANTVNILGHIMSFKQFFLLLRARYWIVILTLFSVVAIVVTASFLMPRMYKATATLLLNYRGADPVTGNMIPGQSMPGSLAILVATQVDVIKSSAVSMVVVDELKLADSPDLREEFDKDTGGRGNIRARIATSLSKRLTVEPSRDSNVLGISFKDSDSMRAALIANAFASAYQTVSVHLNVEPSKLAATYFNEQLKGLRNRVEEANHKLSKYQQDNGIVGITGADFESSRLNELSSQLVTVQNQLMEATYRANNARGGAGDSPDVNANPLIQRLKAELALAEMKLPALAGRYTPEHYLYQAAVAEVEKLRSALQTQIASASKSLNRNAEILQKKEAELQAALLAQKERVLQINRRRDELNILRQEAESSQRAYDTAANRLMMNNFTGQANLSEVSVLAKAVAPRQPSSPKILLNLALSIILGSVMGVGLAIFTELLDRRARSAKDLVDILRAPVMGVMPRQPRSPRQILASRLRLTQGRQSYA